MGREIKIGDTVIYLPSLDPIVCEVRGIMGNYITVRDCDGVVVTKHIDDFYPLTDEEYDKLKELKGEENTE